MFGFPDRMSPDPTLSSTHQHSLTLRKQPISPGPQSHPGATIQVYNTTKRPTVHPTMSMISFNSTVLQSQEDALANCINLGRAVVKAFSSVVYWISHVDHPLRRMVVHFAWPPEATSWLTSTSRGGRWTLVQFSIQTRVAQFGIRTSAANNWTLTFSTSTRGRASTNRSGALTRSGGAQSF